MWKVRVYVCVCICVTVCMGGMREIFETEPFDGALVKDQNTAFRQRKINY